MIVLGTLALGDRNITSNATLFTGSLAARCSDALLEIFFSDEGAPAGDLTVFVQDANGFLYGDPTDAFAVETADSYKLIRLALPAGGHVVRLDSNNVSDDVVRLSAVLLDVSPAAALAALGFTSARATLLDRLDAAITSRLAAAGYTAPLDAAGVRSAVGLTTAALTDVRLNRLDANVSGAATPAQVVTAITNAELAGYDQLVQVAEDLALRPTLAQINASTVLAKEATAGAINAKLPADTATRLNRLDANVSGAATPAQVTTNVDILLGNYSLDVLAGTIDTNQTALLAAIAAGGGGGGSVDLTPVLAKLPLTGRAANASEVSVAIESAELAGRDQLSEGLSDLTDVTSRILRWLPMSPPRAMAGDSIGFTHPEQGTCYGLANNAGSPIVFSGTAEGSTRSVPRTTIAAAIAEGFTVLTVYEQAAGSPAPTTDTPIGAIPLLKTAGVVTEPQLTPAQLDAILVPLLAKLPTSARALSQSEFNAVALSAGTPIDHERPTHLVKVGRRSAGIKTAHPVIRVRPDESFVVGIDLSAIVGDDPLRGVDEPTSSNADIAPLIGASVGMLGPVAKITGYVAADAQPGEVATWNVPIQLSQRGELIVAVELLVI